MRRVPLLGLSCLLLAPLSVPAVAAGNAKEEAQLRKIVYGYAKCVVRGHHNSASEAILSTSTNGTIMRHYSQIIDGECLNAAVGYVASMRFPEDTYRNALADALVNADFATHGDASFDNRLPLAQPVPATEEQKAKALAAAKSVRARKDIQAQQTAAYAWNWLARYGECVVRQNPEGARFWLLTPPETPEETSRIHALQPAFEACLGNRTMKFNRTTMRGTVAINYYRLAMATVVAGAGSVH